MRWVFLSKGTITVKRKLCVEEPPLKFYLTILAHEQIVNLLITKRLSPRNNRGITFVIIQRTCRRSQQVASTGNARTAAKHRECFLSFLPLFCFSSFLAFPLSSRPRPSNLSAARNRVSIAALRRYGDRWLVLAAIAGN